MSRANTSSVDMEDGLKNAYLATQQRKNNSAGGKDAGGVDQLCKASIFKFTRQDQHLRDQHSTPASKSFCPDP